LEEYYRVLCIFSGDGDGDGVNAGEVFEIFKVLGEIRDR
jgi:hypothetical protein